MSDFTKITGGFHKCRKFERWQKSDHFFCLSWEDTLFYILKMVTGYNKTIIEIIIVFIWFYPPKNHLLNHF